MSLEHPIRVALVALGCAKALVDSEKMMALLAEAGCVVGAPADDADVIVVNTCAFIRPATDESVDAIAEALQFKAAGAARRVVVAGCLPQRQSDALLAKMPGIDAIVGVFDREAIVEAVVGQRDEPFVRVGRKPSGCEDDRGRFRLTPRHTAYLRLAEGCNAGCSYCTIPFIRGRLRSKPADLLIEEARELVADGAVELNLIAQDTTAYGSDFDDDTDLAGLLRRLDEIDGLRWIRLMYAHPATMTDDVIDAVAECESVVKYLDIPLQHVADRVLERMRRGYGRARIDELLATLRRRIDGIAIRTTFIVGFPGETREEFRQLVDFVAAEGLAAVGVFPYWPEEGTAAAKLPDQLPERTRTRRRDRLMKTQQQIAFAANDAMMGRTLDVLVDGIDPEGRTVARHAAQAPDTDSVCYPTERVEPGKIVRAEVVGYDGYDLVVQAISD